MKYLKMLGLAAVAAMALTAFTAGSASAASLEVGGVKQESNVKLEASLEAKSSAVLSRTDGSLANTCANSSVTGETEKNFTTEPTGKISVLTFETCERPVTVHKAGQLFVKSAGGTDGTVFSEEAEVTVGSPFGTLNCKTGSGAHLGTLTGTDGTPATHAVMDINAVLNCGFLVPSASWKGTYIVTSPTGLGVVA